MITEGYWKGFQDGVSDGPFIALEYRSDSGMYGYNPAHRLAYQAGYNQGQELLIAHAERDGKKFRLSWRYEVPGEVFRKCYDAVGIR